MLKLTQDPNILILYQTEDSIVYHDITTDQIWMILGKCSYCGECIEGAVNPDLRPYNLRLDIPTRPEIKDKGCSLKGVYLNGD